MRTLLLLQNEEMSVGKVTGGVDDLLNRVKNRMNENDESLLRTHRVIRDVDSDAAEN